MWYPSSSSTHTHGPPRTSHCERHVGRSGPQANAVTLVLKKKIRRLEELRPATRRPEGICLSRRRSRRSIWVWLFDFVVDADTSLRMSRCWKECRHLAPDVSILERVSVTSPSCIREGCMSCVVVSTYVSMSIYVSCAGMSRRTYGSCENCVYKEGCLLCFVFFFSSCNLWYSIRNINLVSVSSVSSVSVSLYWRRLSRAPRLCPTRPSDAVRLSVRHVRLTLSVPVRHVRPTLSVSWSDTSI